MANKSAGGNDTEVAERLAALRRELDQLSEGIAKSGSDKVDTFASDVRNAGDRLVRDAADRFRGGRDASERQVAAAQDWVRDHPLTALACAVGVGMLLAHLRRHD